VTPCRHRRLRSEQRRPRDRGDLRPPAESRWRRSADRTPTSINCLTRSRGRATLPSS